MADKQIYMAGGCVAVAILLIDLMIPLGVAAGVPYIIVILLSLNATDQRTTIYLALVCTFLIIVGYIASPEGGVMWQVLFNRLLAVFAVWTTAVLAIRQLKKERQLNQEYVKNIKIAQEIQIRLERMTVLKTTMRTVLDIVGNFLNNLQLIRIKIEQRHHLTKTELNQLEHLIQDTASKLRKLADIDSIQEKEMAGGMAGIDFENSRVNREAPTDNERNSFF